MVLVVITLALDSSGNLYAGGNFTLAGGVANTVRIAKWDGSVWTPLSTGLTDTVLDIAIDKNDNVYVAGYVYKCWRCKRRLYC